MIKLESARGSQSRLQQRSFKLPPPLQWGLIYEMLMTPLGAAEVSSVLLALALAGLITRSVF